MVFVKGNHHFENKKIKPLMRMIRCIVVGSLIALAGCRSSQKIVTALPQTNQTETTETVPTTVQSTIVSSHYTPQPAVAAFTSSDNLLENKVEAVNQPLPASDEKSDFDHLSAEVTSQKSNNIQSFDQVKQMVATKQLNLSKKQLKRLDKLESKYHGDFNKFKDDAGNNLFDTQTSKIIAAVGVVGLLLLIISGSGFGAFILVLSVGALLLKWLHIISF